MPNKGNDTILPIPDSTYPQKSDIVNVKAEETKSNESSVERSMLNCLPSRPILQLV